MRWSLLPTLGRTVSHLTQLRSYEATVYLLPLGDSLAAAAAVEYAAVQLCSYGDLVPRAVSLDFREVVADGVTRGVSFQESNVGWTAADVCSAIEEVRNAVEVSTLRRNALNSAVYVNPAGGPKAGRFVCNRERRACKRVHSTFAHDEGVHGALARVLIGPRHISKRRMVSGRCAS